MKSRLFVGVAILFFAGAARADSEWVGKTAIVKTCDIPLILIDVAGNESEGRPLDSFCYHVLEQKDGRIRVESAGQSGWIDYADIVMLDEAVPYWTEQIRVNPTANAHQFRAGAHILNNELDKAVKDLDETDRLRGITHWSVLHTRAYIWERKANCAEARRCFEAAQKLEPENARQISRFAVFLATCSDKTERDPKLAIVLATKALSIDKDDTDAPMALSLAHTELGDHYAAALIHQQAMNRRQKKARGE
jgi:tetratricopeptide (TPR) repeat protein